MHAHVRTYIKAGLHSLKIQTETIVPIKNVELHWSAPSARSIMLQCELQPFQRRHHHGQASAWGSRE